MKTLKPLDVLAGLKRIGFGIRSYNPSNGHARLMLDDKFVGTIEPRRDGQSGMQVSIELNGTASSRVLQKAVKLGLIKKI